MRDTIALYLSLIPNARLIFCLLFEICTAQNVRLSGSNCLHVNYYGHQCVDFKSENVVIPLHLSHEKTAPTGKLSHAPTRNLGLMMKLDLTRGCYFRHWVSGGLKALIADLKPSLVRCMQRRSPT